MKSDHEVPDDPMDPSSTTDLVSAHMKRHDLIMLLVGGATASSRLPGCCLLPLLEATVAMGEELPPEAAITVMNTASVCMQSMQQLDELPACASQVLLLGQSAAAAHGAAAPSASSRGHVAALLGGTAAANTNPAAYTHASTLPAASARALGKAAPALACLAALAALDGRLSQLASAVLQGQADTVQVHEQYSLVSTACVAVAVSVGRLPQLAAWLAHVAVGGHAGTLPRLPVTPPDKPPKASSFTKLVGPHVFSPSLFIVLCLGGSGHQRLAAEYLASAASPLAAAGAGTGEAYGGMQWYEHVSMLAALSCSAVPSLAAPLVRSCLAVLQLRPRADSPLRLRGSTATDLPSELVQAADSTWWGYTAPKTWSGMLSPPPSLPAVVPRPAGFAWGAPWVTAMAPHLSQAQQAAMFGLVGASGVHAVAQGGAAALHSAMLASVAGEEGRAANPQGRLALLSADESVRSSMASQVVSAASGAVYPVLSAYHHTASAVPVGCLPSTVPPGADSITDAHFGASSIAQANPWVRCSQTATAALVQVLSHSLSCLVPFLQSLLGGLRLPDAAAAPWLGDALGVLHEVCRTRPVQIMGGESVASSLSWGVVDVSLSQSMRPAAGRRQGPAAPAAQHASQVADVLHEILDSSISAPPTTCSAVLLALSPLLELAAREVATAQGGEATAGRSSELPLARRLQGYVMTMLRKAGVHRAVRMRVNAVQGVLACLRAAVAVAQEGARTDAGGGSQDLGSSQAASELVPAWLSSLLLDCMTLLRRACTQQVHVRCAVLEGVHAVCADIAARCRLLLSAHADTAGDRQEVAILLYTLAQLDAVVAWRLLSVAPLWRTWWEPPQSAAVLGLEGAVDVSPLPLDLTAATTHGSVVCEPLPELLRAASAVASALQAGVQAARGMGLAIPEPGCDLRSLMEAASQQGAGQAAGVAASSGGRKRARELDGGCRQWAADPVLRGVGVASAACTPAAIVAIAAQVAGCDTEKWQCLSTAAGSACSRSQRQERCAQAELLGACSAALLDGVAQHLAPYGSQAVASQPVLMRVQRDLLQLLCQADSSATVWAHLGKKPASSKEDTSDSGSVATPATAPAGTVVSAATAVTVAGGGASAGLASMPPLSRLPHPCTWLWVATTSGLATDSDHHVACIRSAAVACALWLHAQGRFATMAQGGLTGAGLAGSPLQDCAAWELQCSAVHLLQPQPGMLLLDGAWRPAADCGQYRLLTVWGVAALVPLLSAVAAVCGPLPHEALHSDATWKTSTLTSAVMSGARIASLLGAVDDSVLGSTALAGQAAAARAVAAAAAAAASTGSSSAFRILARDSAPSHKRPRAVGVGGGLSLSQDSDASQDSTGAPTWPQHTPGVTLQTALQDVQDNQSALVPAALCWLRSAAGCGAPDNSMEAALSRLGEAAGQGASQSQAHTPEHSHESSMLMGTQAQVAPQRPGWLLDCLAPVLCNPGECSRLLQQLAAVLQRDGAQDLGQKACEAWGGAIGLGVLSLRRKRKWAMEVGLPSAMDGVDAPPKAPLVADGAKLQGMVVHAIGFAVDRATVSVQLANTALRPAATAWALGCPGQLEGQGAAHVQRGRALLAAASTELKICCVWQAALLRAKLEWKAFKQLLAELKRTVLLASQCMLASHVLCMLQNAHELESETVQLVEVVNSLLFPAFFNVVPAEQQYQSSAAGGKATQAANSAAGAAALNRLGKAIKQRADSERKLFPALIVAMSEFENHAVTVAQQCLVLSKTSPDTSGARAVSQVYGSWFRRAVNRDFKLNASALQQLLADRQPEEEE